GIGLEVTRILLGKLSTKVVAFSRSSTPELGDLKIQHGDSLTIFQGDVTSSDAIASAITTTLATYGQLDGVVLNAGTLDPLGRIVSTPIQAWKTAFDINFFSLVEMLQASVPHLRTTNGRVVYVSSGAAVSATAAWGPYNAAKAAGNSLVRTLANEEPDITIVALRPGAVDTEMQANLRAKGKAHMKPEEMERFVTMHEGGKLVKPQDCGHVIAALAVSATKDLSGKFVSWDEPSLAPYRQ
ncbi:hypothetical protein FRB99_003771, partial [Tulasnella sp. 403]